MDNNINNFLTTWGEAANTSAGFFWMALWAFVLGYVVSSIIQVFVTEKRMQKSMGGTGGKSVLLGTFFGFISSSCSFSALASSKSLFQKGSSFVASLAFLLASTNLVVELGIVIYIFLGWQFVVGEYLGGILLILFSWLFITIIKPSKLIERARKNLKENKGHEMSEGTSFMAKLSSIENWSKVGKQYAMEWKMVWKDVTIGFTIAGIVSAFVPDTFFQTLFINSGNYEKSFDFFTLLQHTLVGPIAAFLTFIGSMGNIPLAALLFTKGVSFAGVMAFIFSDLVVFPVLRINAKYYGWKMSFFILFILFSSLIVVAMLLHYGFDVFGILPDMNNESITERDFFQLDYTFFMNIAFLMISGLLIYLGFFTGKQTMHHKEMAPKSKTLEVTLKWIAVICYLWLAVGLFINFFF